MFRQRIISIIFFCLYLAAVAYLCFAKTEDIPELPEMWLGIPFDKIGHFLMFMPFPILGYMTLYKHNRKISAATLILIGLIILGIAVAFGTELVQAHLQYRSFELTDIASDTLGLLFGGFLVFSYFALRRAK